MIFFSLRATNCGIQDTFYLHSNYYAQWIAVPSRTLSQWNTLEHGVLTKTALNLKETLPTLCDSSCQQSIPFRLSLRAARFYNDPTILRLMFLFAIFDGISGHLDICNASEFCIQSLLFLYLFFPYFRLLPAYISYLNRSLDPSFDPFVKSQQERKYWCVKGMWDRAFIDHLRVEDYITHRTKS